MEIFIRCNMFNRSIKHIIAVDHSDHTLKVQMDEDTIMNDNYREHGRLKETLVEELI